MLVYWLALSLFLFLVAPSGLAADETDAGMEQFRAGIQSFENGNLNTARAQFESAVAAGLTSSSLFYNLGVTCYQLGDYPAAEAAFRRLLDGQNSYLAGYNLGLVALERGDTSAAKGWFEQSAAPGAPEKIRALSLAQLDKLGEGEDVARPRKLGTRQAYLAVSGGYDSNIAGLPEDTASSEGGVFLEALAAGTQEIPANGSSRLAAEVAAYVREYPSEESYNTRVLQGQGGWSDDFDGGQRGAAVTVAQSWFDTQALERRYGVEGYYRWRDCALVGRPDRCGITVAAATVDGGSGFEAYDGQWYRARARALKYYGRWRLDSQYTLEINDRRDLRTTNEFISVSPTHHTFEVKARYRWQPELVIGAAGSIRHSRYQDAHVVVASAGESGHREDNRLEVGMLAERALDAHWLVRGEWLVRDNSSSLDQYSYERQTILFTLEGAF